MGNSFCYNLIPMRILVFSDIHANIIALEAVLADAGQIDAAWCLGDLVGYGPDPNDCIKMIRTLPNLICTLGNHDAAAIGHIDLDTFNFEAQLAVYWTQENLTNESLKFLYDLPQKVIINQVTLTHGSPCNPVWEYLLDLQTAARNFDCFSTPLCFVGHTHLPLAFHTHNGGDSLDWKVLETGESFQIQGRTILNPGSVGQPRDHNPLAAYAIFDPEKNTWDFHRVNYDIASIQQRIILAGLPFRHAARLSEGW
jgi:diadenosine tetraphosphatase ApaH/serine/threonine PP2A family protein phosphatase